MIALLVATALLLPLVLYYLLYIHSVVAHQHNANNKLSRHYQATLHSVNMAGKHMHHSVVFAIKVDSP